MLVVFKKMVDLPDVPKAFLWIFLICNIVSIFFANDIMQALKFFMITSYLMLSSLFFIGAINHYGERALKVIYSGYTLAALYSAAIGALAYLHMIPSYESFTKYGRAVALFKDPNVFSPFLIPVAIYSIMMMTKKGLARRTFWISTFGVVSIGVLTSFSRASWGNYLLSIFIFLLISSKGNLKKIGAMFVALSLAGSVLLVVAVSTPEISNMFEARFKLQGYDQDRFSTHESALNAAINNPLGIGPGQSEEFFNYATHNVYLRVLGENGFIGFMGFFGFMFLTLIQAVYRSLKTKGDISNHYALAAASIIGILGNSLVIDSLHWRHLWLLAAIAWMKTNTPEPPEKMEEEPAIDNNMSAKILKAS
jgi:O-antigen ligase